MDKNLNKKINNCFLGALIGSIIGHKLEGANFTLTFDGINKKYGIIDDITDEKFFDKNLDWEIAEIAIEAYLEKQGRINYRDFSNVLINNYNVERLEKFLNEEDFKAPTYFELRNACELIKNGVPEKIVGYFNIISNSPLCLAVPIGIFNIFNPDQAFYDGLEITSALQRDVGRICPAIMAAFVSMLFGDESFDALTKKVLNFADIEINIFNDNKIKKVNIAELLSNIIKISSKYDNPVNAREELYSSAVKSCYQKFDQEPLNVIQKVFAVLSITGFNFKDAVIGAANLSGNSTTIGFLCGAIAGSRSGDLLDKWVKKIPQQRIKKIKNYSESFVNLITLENTKREKLIKDIEYVL
jgi:ADP-ribosylglycohydrolase